MQEAAGPQPSLGSPPGEGKSFSAGWPRLACRWSQGSRSASGWEGQRRRAWSDVRGTAPHETEACSTSRGRHSRMPAAAPTLTELAIGQDDGACWHRGQVATPLLRP